MKIKYTNKFVKNQEEESLPANIKSKIDKKVEQNIRYLASKEDLIKGLSDVKNRLTQKIYWISLIQILAIIGIVIAMFKLFK
ncbi:hypothetical protein [Flavobacterium sp. LB3P122]|uniref:hypothetical protein n=1 Tax=Flavobacterium algoriphilum TaxID=3398738 RepID=UPI003A8810E6